MGIKYDIDKIKFSVDEGTYGRALELYQSGKVTGFKPGLSSHSAVVRGTRPYRVMVEDRNFNLSYCECYLGQRDILCKHIVAVAITALTDSGKVQLDLAQDNRLKLNSEAGELDREELAEVRSRINAAIGKIKYYDGPSSRWFAYQNSLDEACNRLRVLFSRLPVSPGSASLIVASLIKIDRKLCRGVDDSNGTIGGFISEAVELLVRFADKDPACRDCFKPLAGRRTCFGWEEPLLGLVEQTDTPDPKGTPESGPADCS